MNITSSERGGEGMPCLTGDPYKGNAVILEDLPEGLNICMSEEDYGDIGCDEESVELRTTQNVCVWQCLKTESMD